MESNFVELVTSPKDFVLWFPKGNKIHPNRFTKKWFARYKMQYNLPNNIVLLQFVDKFDLNIMFINVKN